jgi:hypothetical protein
MPAATAEKIADTAKVTVETLSVVAKNGAEALTQSGNVAVSGFTTLAKVYQELASRNVEKLTGAFKAISAVKSPTEFFEIQQKLVKEGFEAAVSDSQVIAKLTSSVFTAAFEPMQKQVEALQKMTKFG